MSWIISLGAGREQLALIRAIQAEGYSCVAFDIDPKAPGADVADAFMAISNRDHETILAEIGPMEVAGVMAAASEVPDVMAILAHRLGLPGVPVATGMLLKDKLAYKEALKAAGVPHTEAYPVYGGGLKEAFDRLGHEVVIKPRSGSGSRGVSIHRHDPMGLPGDAAEWDHSEMLIERFQPGPQISAEHIIWAGRAYEVAFVDRFYEPHEAIKGNGVSYRPNELGGSSPSEWRSESKSAYKLIARAASALGIVNGTIKSDLVLTEDGPKIIELTCRLSGGPLSRIVLESTGVDYLRQAVRIAVGKEPEWASTIPRTSARVAMDMDGNKMDWEESRKYIVKELGKVRK